MTDASGDLITRHRSTALKGVKVLELAWVIAGPLSAKYFADNGATVVHIESMSRPDLLRTSEPFKDRPGVNRAGVYAFYSANKHSMAINLRHPQAMKVLDRLISWADIVTENFAPGKIEEMGLGYDKLKQIKPDIIMLRLSIQGQTGPHARHPGYGILAAGLAGVTGITGWPDRVPSTPVAGYTDTILPRFAATMMLAALDYKLRTGRGQCIDISQFETCLQFLAPEVLDYTTNKRVLTRRGNFSPVAVPHNAYRCRGDDRWCVIAVSTDDEWQALCNVIGHPGLPAKPGFRTLLERKENEAEIDQLVQAWAKNVTAEEAVAKLQGAGVASGIVQNARDLLHDPQLERSFWLLNHDELGPYHHLGQAFTFLGSESEECMPAPCLGQHTEYVCRQILGMSDEEFIELVSAGVFE